MQAACRQSQESKRHARLFAWFLCVLFAFCSLLLADAALADCESLTPAQFQSIRNKTDPAYQLQAAIRTAYGIDDSMLSDGYIGRQTARELIRFCSDLNLREKDSGALADTVIEALTAFKKLADQRTDPDWRDTLETQEFETWAENQPAGTYGGFFHYVSGARLIPGGIFMLALYDARQTAPPPAPEPPEPPEAPEAPEAPEPPKPPETKEADQADPGAPLTGLFVLNEADFETLKNRAKAVQNLDSLIGSSGSDRFELLEDVAGRLELDALQSRAFLDPLLKAAENTSAMAETATPGKGGGSGGNNSKNKDEISSKNNETDRQGSEQEGKVANSRGSETQQVYEITEATLSDPAVRTWKASFLNLDPALTSLKGLTDIRFPDGVLFRTAVRLSGAVDQNDTATMNVLLRAARKPPTREGGEDLVRRPPTETELALAPVQWKSGGCGCGIFESLDPNYPSYLYGMYPYWEAPQAGNQSNQRDPQTVAFSLLNRVGYYGVTFNSDARIIDPLHFKQQQQPQDGWFWQRRNFADFVEKAHQYKTNVDLVVFNARWDRFAAPGFDRATAGTRLIESITEILTEELEGPINDIKPLVSLGMSPARTLGDGVTFHFDFRDVKVEDQETLFNEMLDKEFFKALKENLKVADGSTKRGIDYFTNIIVPGECMTEDAPDNVPGCNFYRLENLEEIVEFIDLFLIDFSSANRGDDLLATLEALLNYVGSIDSTERKGAEKQKALLRKKIVPLANLPRETEDAPALQESLAYADWYFSGFGSWNTENDEKTQQALRAVFTRGGDDGALRQLEASVCNFACPQRWWIRAFMALAALVGLVYAIASYWVFRLRNLYSHRGFLYVIAIIAVVLVVTFLCDPYWARKQPVILLVAALGIFAAWVVWRWRKEQQHRYP